MSAVTTPLPSRSTWTRSYPPLVLLVVAVLVAALVLPSALNMPQSNPTTVLEYAPVPPEDDSPPADDGNVSALGLGATDTLAEGGDPPPPPPPPPDEGRGERPQQKRCVGNPPRQTEDPMSPPCVPFFDGDNFGATYQGVTGEEIKVLVYVDSGCYNFECPDAEDAGKVIDLDQPARPPCPKTWPRGNSGNCDFLPIRLARAFGRYFNDRFQTYNRRVHYYMYVTTASSASQRRKDAAELWAELKPFAVIDQATFSGHNEAFVDALSARGVLSFTQQTALRNEFFRRNAPLAWGFWPDVERWAPTYISYVCSKLAPHPVRRFNAGQGPPNDEQRRFGLFYTTDPGEPGLQHFARLVKQGLRDCGVEWETEVTFPKARFAVDSSDSGVDQTQGVARFMDNDVTTVLWLGGVEGRFTPAADAAKYYPEIVFAGDMELDNNVTARHQNPNVWRNAWGTHYQLRMGRPEEQHAYQAYRESYAQASRDQARYADDVYRDHFMLFQAIQVAGPRLTPESIDQGFHAIPEKESTDPYIAAFFFDPGDYTSVKDSTEVWWDPQGVPPGGADEGSASGVSGCYRLVNEGHRYLAGRWQGGDDAFRNPDDPCTGFEGARRMRI